MIDQLLPFLITGALGTLLGITVAAQFLRGDIEALEAERDRARAEADLHAANARLFAAAAYDQRTPEEIEALRRMLAEDEPDPSDWWKKP